MPLTRSGIKGHLESEVRIGFLKGSRDFTPQRSSFVQEFPSRKAFEVFADMGEVPWPSQTAGNLGSSGTDSRTGFQQTNQATGGGATIWWSGEERGIVVYPVDWTIAIPIKQNAIDDDTSGELENWARGAGERFEEHKDFLSFDMLEKGDGTTYGNDFTGSTFFNNSKTYPGAENQTAQDNLNALALTIDNYDTVNISAAKFLDSRSQPLGFRHQLLIHPPDLLRRAFNIVENEWADDTANRERNPFRGRSRIEVPGTWFSSTTWVIIDNSKRIKPIILVNRKDPQPKVWLDEDASPDGVWKVKIHARYAGVYGHPFLAAMGNT